MSPSVTTLKHWRLERDERGLAWLCVDKADSSANVLSRDVMAELDIALDELTQDPPDGLVIYSGKEKGFIAGADINEFPRMADEAEAYALIRNGQALFDRLEKLPFSSVAVIDGFALGGGLELALACSWRIACAAFKPTLGLPEVNLGLHPGFGGTVRLVRLIGVREAMAMMLSGRSVTAEKARKIGLVDRIVPPEGDWRSAAAELAVASKKARRAPLLDRLLGVGVLRPLFARVLRRQVEARARADHYPAPFAMVELWQLHGASDDTAFVAEAKSFARLVQSETSRNLVRVYGLQERLKRLGSGGQPDAARHVHVVGAGVMGGDIAAWCALRGLTVTLQDRELRFIEPALERAGELFAKRLRGPGEAQAARQRLSADVSGAGVARADVVIEAIFEDREAKQNLYRQLEPGMRPDALLATNTSSIPLQELAPCLQNPGRLVGLHFFNPVAKLPLVEIVSAPDTSAEVTAAALAFARQIGKLPLPCRSLPGFLVNRILGPYMAEAMELLSEGLAPAVIDQAAVDFGMPMGPIELADSVGLDVALHVARVLSPVIGREPAPELAAKVADGQLGRKSGSGFYSYRDGSPQRERVAPDSAPEPARERLVLALLNEAANCLADGLVDDADLVDAGAIFGTGFAPFRGGPLNYARSRGVEAVVAELRRLTEQHGERFRPSAGWSLLVPDSGTRSLS